MQLAASSAPRFTSFFAFPPDMQRVLLYIIHVCTLLLIEGVTTDELKPYF